MHLGFVSHTGASTTTTTRSSASSSEFFISESITYPIARLFLLFVLEARRRRIHTRTHSHMYPGTFGEKPETETETDVLKMQYLSSCRPSGSQVLVPHQGLTLSVRSSWHVLPILRINQSLSSTFLVFIRCVLLFFVLP